MDDWAAMANRITRLASNEVASEKGRPGGRPLFL